MAQTPLLTQTRTQVHTHDTQMCSWLEGLHLSPPHTPSHVITQPPRPTLPERCAQSHSPRFSDTDIQYHYTDRYISQVMHVTHMHTHTQRLSLPLLSHYSPPEGAPSFREAQSPQTTCLAELKTRVQPHGHWVLPHLMVQQQKDTLLPNSHSCFCAFSWNTVCILEFCSLCLEYCLLIPY